MIEFDLGITHHFFPSLYAKEMLLPAGSRVGSHKHAYDHISALFSGAVNVEVDGVTTEYRAPAFVLVKAGLEHVITALEDAVWFCVHETDETNTDNIDRVLIEGN